MSRKVLAASLLQNAVTVEISKPVRHAHFQAMVDVHAIMYEFPQGRELLNEARAKAGVADERPGNYARFELLGKDGLRASGQAFSSALQAPPITPAHAAFPGHTTREGARAMYPSCTEFQLLNSIDSLAVLSPGPAAPSSYVTLYTELAPCPSCTRVIEQFATKYPSAKLVIKYREEKDPKLNRANVWANLKNKPKLVQIREDHYE